MDYVSRTADRLDWEATDGFDFAETTEALTTSTAAFIPPPTTKSFPSFFTRVRNGIEGNRNPGEETYDVFFLVSVVAPLIFCCFAIFLCAINSILKTRKKLEAFNLKGGNHQEEYTEFTIDMTTKMDSCVELSSTAISSKEESVLL